MKILFHSIEALLDELRDRSERIVRIAPLVKKVPGSAPGRPPDLISRVVVTAVLDAPRWAEWRYWVGRGAGEAVARGWVLPGWLQRESDEALATVARHADGEGFQIREGIICQDAGGIDTFRLPGV